LGREFVRSQSPFSTNKTGSLSETRPSLQLSSDAEATLDQAHTVALQSKDVLKRIETLCEVAEAYTNCGRADVATQLLNECAQLTELDSDILNRTLSENIRRQCVGTLALACAKCGFWDWAENIIERQSDKEHPDTQRALALVLASKGKAPAAIQVIRNMRNPPEQSKGFRDVAVALAKGGLSDQAVSLASEISTNRDVVLHRIAEVFVAKNDKNHFNALIVPNAWFLNSSFLIIGLMARLYPDKATEILAALRAEGFVSM
jgi:hypothetical protein